MLEASDRHAVVGTKRVLEHHGVFRVRVNIWQGYLFNAGYGVTHRRIQSGRLITTSLHDRHVVLFYVEQGQFVLFNCLLIWPDLKNRVLLDHLLELLPHLEDAFNVSFGLPIGVAIIVTFSIFDLFLDVFQVLV